MKRPSLNCKDFSLSLVRIRSCRYPAARHVISLSCLLVASFSASESFLPSHAFAQGISSRLDDPLTPTIPRGIPQSQEGLEKPKKELEKRLIRNGQGGKRRVKLNTFDDETPSIDPSLQDSKEGEDKSLYSIGQVRIPNIDSMRSGAKRENGRNVMGPSADLPVFIRKPPKGIGAYLGQTLALRVDAKVRKDRGEDVYFAWILNSKVICTGKTCLIPLDGVSADVGAQALTIVAFHTGGSSRSDHVLQIVQGSWKKGQPFNRRFIKRVMPKVVDGVDREVSALDQDRDHVYALSGGAVHAYPGYFQIIGDVGQNMPWRGRLRTNSSGVARIIKSAVGEWYMLRRSTLRFIRQESPSHREIFIEDGGVRMRTDRRETEGSEALLPLEDMGLETDEVRVVALEGADVFVVRSKEQGVSDESQKADSENASEPQVKALTRVTVISGSAIVKLKVFRSGEPNQYNLSPGFELVVHSDGTVEPLGKPEKERMEKLQKMTITPGEVAAQIAADNAQKAKDIDLAATIKEAQDYLAQEDYFETMASLSPVLSRSKEDVRLPYYYGVANKGLYQAEEARKHLQIAHEQDPNYYQAAWELALLSMEEKKWHEAIDWLERARDKMEESDPRIAEYFYYRGVSEFQSGRDFSARSDFTRALWAKNLESSLQGSAASFLSALTTRKGWGLVAPFGLQYDLNVLSLGEDDPLPPPFEQRETLRSIAALIFSADPGAAAKESGTFWGVGGKAMSINNLSPGFSSLDVLLGELSLSQSFVSFTAPDPKAQPQGSPEKKTTKVSQSLGVIVLNSEPTSLTGSLGLNWNDFDFKGSYEASLAEGATGDDHAVVFEQGTSFGLADLSTGVLSLGVLVKERIPFKTDASKGITLNASLLPGYTHLFSPRLTANASWKIEPDYVLADPNAILSFTTGPTIGATYFISPWFIALPGLTYEFIFSDARNAVVQKPLASLLFTALF